jgi:hypothetical protein
MRARGFATGSVLLLAMVVMLLSVSIGALAYTQLLASQAGVHSNDALLLAESAINETISQLSTTHGRFGTAPTDQIVFQPDPTDASRTGTVSFNASSGLPWSTNNLAGTLTAVTGYRGAPVAPQYARLIGVGTSHGLRRQVEALVQAFQFPYALACAGTLTTDVLNVTGAGSLTFFVTSDGVPDPHGTASVAYLGSSTLAPPAVHIDGQLYYLDSGGGVSLPAGAFVFRTRAISNLELPVIDVPTLLSNALASILAVGTPAAYNTAVAPGAGGTPTVTGGYVESASDPAPVGGLVTQNCILQIGPGSLTVSGGDLQVNDSVLFVDGSLTVLGNVALNHGIVYVTNGNVTITGSISGGGAIVTDSSINFHGMTLPDYATEIGVVAQGSVTLNPAPGPGPSFFQGMLYSGGDLNINGGPGQPIRVGGVVLAQGNATINNTLISYIDECAALRFATWQPAAPPAFGDIQVMGTTPTFQALDALPAVSSTSFSAAEVSTIYSAVNSLALASPPYAAQCTPTMEPLVQITLNPAFAMHLQPIFFDSNVGRYVQPHSATKYSSGGAGCTQAVFDAAATASGTSGDSYKNILLTAQGLARLNANQQLANDENAALSAGFNGLPVALGAERISLNLAQWLRKTAGQPSYGIVAWRTW